VAEVVPDVRVSRSNPQKKKTDQQEPAAQKLKTKLGCIQV
jgi:hypothetical protein